MTEPATRETPRLRLTVVVPTYRRPDDLRRCLQGLARLERSPDEVLVVHRVDDEESARILDEFRDAAPYPKEVFVEIPGLTHALDTGLRAATGDVVVFTDDDSIPRPDWLGRIEAHYDSDQAIGGVGGRDWVHELGTTLDGSEERVGVLDGFGRMIGNHHLGVGPARDVDALKGVNMSFRRELLSDLGFDPRLRGPGAQVANELTVCLPLRKRGWRIIYDPAVAVDHYPSVRHDADKRYTFNFGAGYDSAHNQTLPIYEHLPPLRRAVFVAHALLVGTRSRFGLLQFLRFLPTKPRESWNRLRAGLLGQMAAIKTAHSKRLDRSLVVTPDAAGKPNLSESAGGQAVE